MIREPLMLIVAFFVFFFLAFVYVRLDFSISKDEGQEVRLKVSGFCEKIVGLQDQRWNNYEKFDEALVFLKASKDINAFKNSAKAIHADLKAKTQTIDDLAGSLRTLSPEVADKIKELQKLDGYVKFEKIDFFTTVANIVQLFKLTPAFSKKYFTLGKKKVP